MRILSIVGLIASVFLLTGCEDFEKMCKEELGGTVKSDSNVVTTTAYDAKGKPIIGTTVITTHFCIKDGEVIAQS